MDLGVSGAHCWAGSVAPLALSISALLLFACTPRTSKFGPREQINKLMRRTHRTSAKKPVGGPPQRGDPPTGKRC